MRTLSILLLAGAFAALAQQPQIENGHFETRPLTGSLEPAMKQTGPAWIGYSVPIIAGEHHVCGWDGRRGESNHLSLEGPSALFVFYRVEQNAVTEVKLATPDCTVDAGGLPVVWLTGVSPDASVHFLESLVPSEHSAVAAIALHKAGAADRALDAMATGNYSEKIRKDAIFWLGVSRGRHGYEKVLSVLNSDASDKVREHAIFALTQSKEKDAIPAIVRVAREDRSPRVRGQALFWLSQSAQKKIAADAIAKSIADDPETDVKRKAVFALSQLPSDDGVPKLIDVARTNHNYEVRKQALFWLGQSKDPRALKFIEEVLSR